METGIKSARENKIDLLRSNFISSASHYMQEGKKKKSKSVLGGKPTDK